MEISSRPNRTEELPDSPRVSGHKILRGPATWPFEVRHVSAVPSATTYTLQPSGCQEYPKGAGYPVGNIWPLESFAVLTARTGDEQP